MSLVEILCDCENLSAKVLLSKNPAQFQPRVCDCDFCTPRKAAYVSDPEGSLTLVIRDSSKANFIRLGSLQAEFLICTQCDFLLAVLYLFENKKFAAVNVASVRDNIFAAGVDVSPKKLTAEQKRNRWQEVWFRDVVLKVDGGRL